MSFGMLASINEDVANPVGILEKDRHLGQSLHDLKRKRQIHAARHAWQIALPQGIGRHAIREILSFLLRCRGLIWNRVAFHHTLPGGNPLLRGVVLKVIGGGAHRLPKPRQVWPAVRGPGESPGLRVLAADDDPCLREDGHDDGGGHRATEYAFSH